MEAGEKELLVKFGASTKLMKISASDSNESLKNIVKNRFGLAASEQIILQKYSTVWEEYIDISDGDQLNNFDKVQCILKTDTCMTKNVAQSSEAEYSHTIYINADSNIDNSSMSSTSESVSSNCNSQSPACESWSEKFTIPKQKYSNQLKQCLEKELPLNWGCKHELLTILVDEIFRYTYYPTSFEVTSAARNLLFNHPHLTEKIGSGYDGWVLSIRDKLKNARRTLNVPIVKHRKRKHGNSDPAVASTVKRKSIPRGFNPFPKVPDNENMTSCDDVVEVMKKEIKNSRQNIEVIKDCMKRTYAFRRQLVNECSPVKTINSQYPALTLSSVVEQEIFMVLQNADGLAVFKSNIMRVSSGLLDLATKKENENVSKVIKNMEDAKNDLNEISPAEVSKIEAITSVILLHHVFGEDSSAFFKTYSEEASIDDIKEGPRTPHLAIVGSVYHPLNTYIVVEGEITCCLQSVIEGIYYAFGSYYVYNIEYPKSSNNTWSFIQFVLCEVEGPTKPPKKVLTVSSKI